MRKPLVIGNWKMHGSKLFCEKLIKELLLQTNEVISEFGVCPPHAYLDLVSGLLKGSEIKLGAQNVHFEQEGAFTGETSLAMLEDFSCSYVILGHSERRHSFFESDEMVAQKFVATTKSSVIPVLCVGETEADRKAGQTFAVIDKQLDAVINACGIDGFQKAVIAYEPVWAIGTGLTATPEQAQEVHAYIRHKLAESSANIAANMRILYGGSVKPANAESLFQMADIDGGLIGGASLKAQDFIAIGLAALEKVS